jgi:hypothetical protein
MIHISRKGVVLGKYAPHEIAAMLKDGKIESEDYWWMDGMKEWIQVSKEKPPASSPPTLPLQTSWVGDPWLVSEDWQVPPAIEPGDDRPATESQKSILTDYGISPAEGLKGKQASAWISKLPRYPVDSTETNRSYPLESWRSRPPKEKHTSRTSPASEKQLALIRTFDLQPPADLTKQEASRWIDTLLNSEEADIIRTNRNLMLDAAEKILRSTRASRTIGNTSDLTSGIASTVVMSLYAENKKVFAAKEVQGIIGRFQVSLFQDFQQPKKLADALFEKLAKDFPDCVDGGAPSPRPRKVAQLPPQLPPRHQVNTPRKSDKGCALLVIFPFITIGWLIFT